MKKILAFAMVLGASAAWAELGDVTVRSVSANDAGVVTVAYDLGGDEDAVVTMSVTAGGKTYERLAAVGAVGRRVSPASGLTIAWQPCDDVPGGVYDAEAMSVTLKAWSLSTPPDYMAVNLLCFTDVRYYASVAALPEPVSSPRWREDWMLFKRIPAKNVSWTMGCGPRDYCWGAAEIDNPSYGGQPQTRVTNDADFYMGVFEMTQGQYIRITNENPSLLVASSWDNLKNSSHYAAHQTDWKWHPVEQVTWCAATNAVGRLAAWSGLPTRLPTSPEWEFAARGETKGSIFSIVALEWNSQNTRDHIKPIGFNIQASEEYYGGAQNVGHPNYVASMPVGLKVANPYGLYDVIGNVGEWCDGWYDEAKGLRPFRGGSMHMSGEGMGVGYCIGLGETAKSGANSLPLSYEMGFRVACSIP